MDGSVVAVQELGSKEPAENDRLPWQLVRSSLNRLLHTSVLRQCGLE